MLDVQNPHIDVDELMEKIRAEVARRRANASNYETENNNDFKVEPQINNLFSDKWLQVENAISQAQQVSQVGVGLPGMHTFKGWKRKIAVLIGNAYLRISQLITRDQRAFNQSVVNAIRALEESTKEIESVVAKNYKNIKLLDDLKERIEEQPEDILARIHKVEEQSQRHLNEFVYKVKTIESKIEEQPEDIKKLLEERLDKLEKCVNNLKQDNKDILNKLSWRINEIEKRVINQPGDIINRISEQFNQKVEGYISDVNNLNQQVRDAFQKIGDLKTALLLQERRLTLLLEEARRRLPEPFSQEQLETFVNHASDIYDPLYLQFEDHFRGNREDIKERQKAYLPLIIEAEAGTRDRPVLDLGCGRGEWLEVLKEEGLVATGVDLNNAMVNICKDRELEVYRDDIFNYLHKMEGNSLGAVTAFHVIEHLTFNNLIKLLDETYRVLKPGGIFIFETPNPQNLLVGSCNFYIDPTHKNPIHPATVSFLAEARGLCKVSIINKHDYGPEYHFQKVDQDGDFDILNQNITRLNEFFFSAQDFAVVGYKA